MTVLYLRHPRLRAADYTISDSGGAVNNERCIAVTAFGVHGAMERLHNHAIEDVYVGAARDVRVLVLTPLQRHMVKRNPVAVQNKQAIFYDAAFVGNRAINRHPFQSHIRRACNHDKAVRILRRVRDCPAA